MANPVYVEVPVTIEIVNMTPQVLSDLVASGKIAVDGANHLNIPQGPMIAKLGPDMLRPGSQAQQIPANSAERPLKVAANQPLLVSASANFALGTPQKSKLDVRGNRRVWLTGHSLGGALAVACAARATFEAPRVGIRGIYT